MILWNGQLALLILATHPTTVRTVDLLLLMGKNVPGGREQLTRSVDLKLMGTGSDFQDYRDSPRWNARHTLPESVILINSFPFFFHNGERKLHDNAQGELSNYSWKLPESKNDGRFTIGNNPFCKHSRSWLPQSGIMETGIPQGWLRSKDMIELLVVEHGPRWSRIKLSKKPKKYGLGQWITYGSL